MGVLESLKVRKQSYPIRFLYKVFVRKYSEIDFKIKRYDELEGDPSTDFKAIVTKSLF